MAVSTERPMLKEPFTHDDVDEFYSQMYSKYVNDPEKPLVYVKGSKPYTRELARIYGVSDGTINDILHRRSWMHI